MQFAEQNKKHAHFASRVRDARAKRIHHIPGIASACATALVSDAAAV